MNGRKVMKKRSKGFSVGTLSFLIGVHNFLFHPITVALAWYDLFGVPNVKELICIWLHDIGYIGRPEMNGESGVLHSEVGARIANKLFGKEYRDLCLYHSRSYAKLKGRGPSKLCYADKLSIKYESAWFYLLRARISGELKLYRQESAENDLMPLGASDLDWFFWFRDRQISMNSKPKISLSCINLL